jgi:hypothetical protein
VLPLCGHFEFLLNDKRQSHHTSKEEVKQAFIRQTLVVTRTCVYKVKAKVQMSTNGQRMGVFLLFLYWKMMQNCDTLYVCREMAQLGRAPGSGSGGRRFKSCFPDHFFYKKAKRFLLTFMIKKGRRTFLYLAACWMNRY